MTNLYSEWRDFYAEKVRSWMSLEELRAECGKLQTVDSPSPEVLLVHAMHALEELQEEASTAHSAVHYHIAEHAKTIARAERLAEALLECMAFLPDRGLPGIAKDKARALLREQEASRGGWQSLTDEHKAILNECRNQAMRWTLVARIPECGIFGGIAQDLDYLCEQLGVKDE